ncbi:hypothetical protein ACFPVT_04315 [Corynebacterium choanae]|uniref:Streptogrisin-B n=1 Tax=Corynebacterium choanae TaxID=1862358 RepID=A0A3G6J937_9CORY|nr:hypothetical protein [Corynebacterium choanae]AZA14419.1 Streptogrisin-B precursor [Corynebacterium choanae]
MRQYRVVSRVAGLILATATAVTTVAHPTASAQEAADYEAAGQALVSLSSMSAGSDYQPGDPYSPPADGGQTPPKKEKRFRYHNSSDWRFLERGDFVTPGSKLHTDTGSCSAGFFVTANGRAYMIWAGHCADVGEQVYWRNPEGTEVLLGETVWSKNDDTDDLALVDITHTRAPIRPNIQLVDDRFGGVVNLRQEGLHTDDLLICRLGYRTGISCGDFDGVYQNSRKFTSYAPADHGDSGGPVFILKGTTWYPVGVVSGGWDSEPDIGSAAEIAQLVKAWNLVFYTG